ncbi:hypothetical protein HWV62_43194 [Athelia sp. TMB]|nr:hypothetical protein HWV62_43194 [Athelia sp. TMB]
MPADPRAPSSSRRPTRNSIFEDTVETKRARGELSCAECKRAKLKCDKRLYSAWMFNYMPQWHLCSSSKLKDKMSQRIQQLEDALASLQSSVSSEPHFLLRDDLLSIKTCSEQQSSDEPSPSDNTFIETLEAFGTLTIDDSGQSKYFGPSAVGTERTSAEPALGEYRPETAAPELLNNLAAESFMYRGYASDSDTFKSAMGMLFDLLPSSMRASSLCETYLENFSWNCQLVTRPELFADFLAPIYKAKKDREVSTGQAIIQISPHKLAFLFLIFAQGALTDLTLPAYNDEAKTYHHYACAALALRSLINAPTVETIQTMVLMAHYRSGADERYSRDSIWALVSMSCKVAQIIGMHRDPTRWHVDEKTVEFRRRVFWDVYATDIIHSGRLGRPPSIELSYVDCAFPDDGEDSNTNFKNWKYQFIRDIFGLVVELTQGTAPPDYKKILELDRKVREMVLPAGHQAPLSQGEENDPYMSTGMYLKRYLVSQFRSASMLFIHKCFFAQALLNHPENPLRSVYATSFLAAYRAASAIIRTAASHVSCFPVLLLRWVPIWGQLFSAAIIVGSIAIKVPSSSMASSAFVELTIGIELFEKGAEMSARARTGLDVLQELREKALSALLHHRNGMRSSASNAQEDRSAELALFGIPIRPPVDKASFPPSHIKQSEAMPPRQNAPALPFEEANSAAMPDVHPSLIQYMSPPSQAGLYLESPTHPAPESSLQFWDQSGPSSFVGPSWNTNGPDDFQQFLDETSVTPAVAPETWGSSNLTDLTMSMVVNSEHDLDEQWLAFMRENGMEF